MENAFLSGKRPTELGQAHRRIPEGVTLLLDLVLIICVENAKNVDPTTRYKRLSISSSLAIILETIEQQHLTRANSAIFAFSCGARGEVRQSFPR